MTIFKFIPFGGTGGGGSGLDRFAPKYVVGNTLAGDSAASYSSDGFRYFPDTGDGAGIAAELAAAAGGGGAVPGDVYIRPGTYTWTGSGVLTVGTGVRVSGAGARTILNFTVPLGQLSDGRIFKMDSGSELRDLVIVATDPANSEALGPALIEVSSQAVVNFERISVSLTRSSQSTSTVLSVFSVPGSSALTADRCDLAVTGTAGEEAAVSLAGWRSNGRLRLDLCTMYGTGDVGVSIGDAPAEPAPFDELPTAPEASIDQCEFVGFLVGGLVATSNATRIIVQGSLFETTDEDTPNGIFVNSASASMILSSSRILLPCDPFLTNTAVSLFVDHGQVTGNTVIGTSGIVSSNAAGFGVLIGFNNVFAFNAPFVSTVAPDIAANNKETLCVGQVIPG